VRHVRMLGLCLVAVFAVCAYAVSSASALPEWGKCEAKPGGKYSDSNCTVKAKKGTGTYEWKKGTELSPVPFKGESVGSGGVLTSEFYGCEHEGNELEQIPGKKRVTRKDCEEHGDALASVGAAYVECSNEQAHGEAAGKNTVTNVGVVFTGCLLLGVAPCSNTQNEGEIHVNPLKGVLGYINKSEKKVGVLLEPSKKNGDFANFTCYGGSIGITVGTGNDKEGTFYTSSGCYGTCPGTTPEEEKHGGYDGIISPIEPVNEMTTHFIQHYTLNPVTKENIPSKFEGKHIELLENFNYNPVEPEDNGSAWSPAGEEITNENIPCEYEYYLGTKSSCEGPHAIPSELKA